MLKTVLAALGAALALSAGPAAAQGASPTLARIKAAKAINVAYSPDSAPFSSVSGNAVPQGYSIELCKRAIAQIARAVGEPELKLNWIAGSVSERVQLVAGGRAELDCANTTQTQTRLASVDFSNLIFILGFFIDNQETQEFDGRARGAQQEFFPICQPGHIHRDCIKHSGFHLGGDKSLPD